MDERVDGGRNVSDIEVRPLRNDDELRDFLRCLGTAFHFNATVTDTRLEFARDTWEDHDRRLGAFVAGSLGGTAGSFATQLTVPGERTVATAAVTQVTVLPTHRRRGLLTAMMRTQLEDAVARGELVAMLIAAEWPIYGRFGYGMATQAASSILDAAAARFLEPGLEGTLELVDPPTLRALAPAVFDRHRITSPGSIERNDVRWDVKSGVRVMDGREPPKTRYMVVHRDQSGEVDGYAVYDTNDEWVHNRPRVRVDVQELLTASDAATRDLWRFLCAIDWVQEVRGHVRPVDEDLRPLLVDGRAFRQEEPSDHMWVRLLDVAGALSARAYEVPVSTTIEVHDPFLERGGRFRLSDGVCTPTGATPDMSMEIDVLGAAYLGGTPLQPYALARRVEEHTPGALAALDRALRTSRAPWATTNF